MIYGKCYFEGKKTSRLKPKPKADLPGRDFSVPRPVKTSAIYQGLYGSFSDKTYTVRYLPSVECERAEAERGFTDLRKIHQYPRPW
jgi:hypothetical protein